MTIEESHKDHIHFPFDRHSGIIVLSLMKDMFYLLGLGLERRQHGISEFIATVSHDTTFDLGYTPTKVDYQYMAYLHKQRLRARLLHIPFYYPL